MKALLSRKSIIIILLLAVLVTIFTFSNNEPRIDYITDVKPIINKKCISCHGGVKSEAGFSLLFRTEALGNTESGAPAIIPGYPEKSEMIRRITHDDPDERMPYKHDALSREEIRILKKWIKEGAVWGDHWAYISLKAVEVPVVSENSSIIIRNNIDRFILNELSGKNLSPSKEADKPTLLRRVSLDLTGLPPEASIAKAFLSDTSSSSYEKLVDALLASPAYGERWTALWVDLARYADTKGYERDDNRTIWRYRDYLIKAFNDDKPYDRFLTEQLAGDLLPDSKDEQLIATAFHRNTMTNNEGGIDNEEFRTAAVIDRVNTTWETLMGTTFACVQCHSHPYDPFKHEDYYKFLAFFNNSRDENTFDDYPVLRHFNKDDSNRLQLLDRLVTEEISPSKAKEITTFIKTWQPSINSLHADELINSEIADTKWLMLRNHASSRIQKVNLDRRNSLITRFISWNKRGVWTIHLDKPKGTVLAKIHLPKTNGWEIKEIKFPQTTGVHDLYFSYYSPEIKDRDNGGVMFDWFYFNESFPNEFKRSDSVKKLFWQLLTASTEGTPVMIENPADFARSTHIFERGNWLVKGDEVKAGVPASLTPLPQNAPNNRLGLAMWMTSPEHPLTARTMVNRLWEQLFGTGIVETLEDFGTQGLPPTHTDLLDYLSIRYMQEFKWSTKRLLKEMVMSATYRQDSRANKASLNQDPYNRYYARGPRLRLNAEQIRDQALFASGLLNNTLYGPSVMPFQPPGIWLSPYSGLEWEKSRNGDEYRRSVYTFWKRTAPYPSMISFDGGAREVCVSRRIRTNTPLQALVTMNDEAFIEMARKLGKQMKHSASILREQINFGYKTILYKNISIEKLKPLEQLYYQALAEFRADKDKTCEMTGLMDHNNNPETAAMIVVANALLNLDEVVTKS